MPATWQGLADALSAAPDFEGAACVGRWPLFDPPDDGESRASVQERHEIAVQVCRQCPALEACREWSLTEKPTGAVVAGTIPATPKRGRPTSAETERKTA